MSIPHSFTIKKESITRSLIILGNGFDLNCGLASRFSDFFEFKFKSKLDYFFLYEHFENDICVSNIWYLLLYLEYYADKSRLNKNSEVKWMDVESFIKSIIVPDKSSSFTRISLEQKYERVRDGISNPFGFFPQDIIERFIFIQDDSYFKHTTNDFLLYWLKEFEKDFQIYLTNIVDNSLDYETKAYSLFNRILAGAEESIVLNFNYTSVSNLNEAYQIFETNIHGSLKDSIIIGIDPQFSDRKDNSILFSKSWRLMLRKNLAPFDIGDEIKGLYFYGHSLSEQDYSYFLWIFDKVKIQNNGTLIFYYSNYENSDEKNEQNLVEYSKSIYSLLEKYGTEVYGVKEGKNLVTRLLLEGRLFIYPLD